MKNINKKIVLAIATIVLTLHPNANIMAQPDNNNAVNQAENSAEKIYSRKINAGGHNIFYRESGPQGAPVILLPNFIAHVSQSYSDIE